MESVTGKPHPSTRKRVGTRALQAAVFAVALVCALISGTKAILILKQAGVAWAKHGGHQAVASSTFPAKPADKPVPKPAEPPSAPAAEASRKPAIHPRANGVTASAPPSALTAPKPAPSAPAPVSHRKVVALTFDDGPDPRWTPAVLDVLKAYHIKATFFVVGRQVEKFPDVAKRIFKEGHVIGNHTWSHSILTKRGEDAVRDEIIKTDRIVQRVTGTIPVWFRAPYGAVSPHLLDLIKATGHQYAGWQVDTRDWSGASPAKMMETVKRQAKDGAIILQHSFGGRKGDLQNTVTFLPEMIQYLQSQGYSFVTVPELMEKKTAK